MSDRTRTENQNRYELQSYLPTTVNGSRIPRFRVTFKELIKFENWQGIGWVRPLYFLVVLLLIVSTIVMEVNFVLEFSEDGSVMSLTIGSLFCAVFLFVTLILNRIVMEVVISILTIPHLLPLSKPNDDRI